MPATGAPATRTHRVSVREMIFSLVSPTTRCVMVSFFFFYRFVEWSRHLVTSCRIRDNLHPASLLINRSKVRFYFVVHLYTEYNI